VPNVNLDRGMVLGGDDPVGGRAARKNIATLRTQAQTMQWGTTSKRLRQNVPLPWDVEVHHLTLLVLHGGDWELPQQQLHIIE
jgi:hypothetical protein